MSDHKQAAIESLAITVRDQYLEIERLQARVEELEAKDAEWKKAAYKAQQIILALEANQQANAQLQWNAACEVYRARVEELQRVLLKVKAEIAEDANLDRIESWIIGTLKDGE